MVAFAAVTSPAVTSAAVTRAVSSILSLRVWVQFAKPGKSAALLGLTHHPASTFTSESFTEQVLTHATPRSRTDAHFPGNRVKQLAIAQLPSPAECLNTCAKRFAVVQELLSATPREPRYEATPFHVIPTDASRRASSTSPSSSSSSSPNTCPRRSCPSDEAAYHFPFDGGPACKAPNIRATTMPGSSSGKRRTPSPSTQHRGVPPPTDESRPSKLSTYETSPCQAPAHEDAAARAQPARVLARETATGPDDERVTSRRPDSGHGTAHTADGIYNWLAGQILEPTLTPDRLRGATTPRQTYTVSKPAFGASKDISRPTSTIARIPRPPRPPRSSTSALRLRSIGVPPTTAVPRRLGQSHQIMDSEQQAFVAQPVRFLYLPELALASSQGHVLKMLSPVRRSAKENATTYRAVRRHHTASAHNRSRCAPDVRALVSTPVTSVAAVHQVAPLEESATSPSLRLPPAQTDATLVKAGAVSEYELVCGDTGARAAAVGEDERQCQRVV
ncbi:hypothetical protein MAPG_04873 [Magnaporthiopsis poae ATCC 64411]|uniref:Uncharacterized protein n=1 Tax=Magnaporthiopsis poae (strain ATCC 64411 / 73-15) TaxID=644358 RepID=A0A0C4DXW6_MAGP6|nr:hypothetical protein MAPG_04873 [Magnaporthiopsis poae ATCC 64411]